MARRQFDLHTRAYPFVEAIVAVVYTLLLNQSDKRTRFFRRKRMLDRRHFLTTCSAMGLGGTLFPGVLWAQAESQGAKKITKEMIDDAAIIAEVPIADEYREMMLDGLNRRAKGYEEIYKLHIPNSVPPAVLFN